MWGDKMRKIKVVRPTLEAPAADGGSGSCYVTPSMLYNALSTSGDGKYAVYAHISDVVLIDMSAAIADFSKSGDGNIDSLACKLLQCKSTVMSVKICETTDSPVVVVGCMESVQIWSCRDGERLTNYTLPNPPIEDDFLTYDRRYYARGAAMVSNIQNYNGSGDRTAVLLVGSSTGILHLFDVEGMRFVYSQALEGHHKAPIADISSSHEADYASHLLAETVSVAVADEAGCVTVWQQASDSLLPICQMRVPGESLTSVRIRGDTVFAASILGKIFIFTASTCALKCEIASHSRPVNSITLHPYMDLLLSVSEDGFVNVWNLENVGSQEIEASTSAAVKDALLCGARFVGEHGKDIVLVQYDVEALMYMPSESLALNII